ncbi:MAG: T9SS type A sorting domain-containing protein [Flavobacterium sp.]|uniref:M12 family metallo-peptidase n=1 Tax=Flavobacterium sp. TaxID=239 RepID=UPI0011F4D553|nr:M12 family metallo-peptidase [Flavobacterium sp.]RZJ68474.1 MAG: T9SS type A sorting domain-containing protein [Flavobacterium sp.]
MKKIFTLLAFVMALGAFAQGKVAEKVAEYKRAKSEFTHFNVLDATSEALDADVSSVVNKATMAKIRTADVNEIVSKGLETIEVDIPYMGSNVTVELYKVNILHEGFHIDTDKAKNIPYQQGVYYRGIVKNDANSVVALSFFNNELTGIVSSQELNNLVIGKQQKAGNTSDYIIYSDAEMKVLSDFNCGMKQDVLEQAGHDHESGETNRDVNSARCVTIYFEIDNNIYVANGSSTTTTANWMTSVFNNVQTLYTNDGITTSLKSTFIWTTPDPYTGDGSSDYLYQFNSVRPVFDGDVGQLVGIDPGGLGGVAVTINGLCSANNFCYSDVNFQFSTVPTYSWTIEVITHELGHLLGSPHTHNCSWNSNNTAIDNCGPYANSSNPNFEGASCMTTPPTIPSTTVKGTIMSYCHLVGGVGISFSNGFGLQPATRIINAVNAATCLSTDCVNTCINTVMNMAATTVTPNSITVTWEDTGGGPWQVGISPFASSLVNWQNTTVPTYTFSGLNANTYYRIRVRPTCTAGLVPGVRSNAFATSANWCNGITITDTGGTAGDYTNDQDYTRVLIPTVANKKIVLTFTVLDLENEYDYLYVHDGPSTASTELTNGGITGENLQGPFTPFVSSSPDGALTLRFFSDQGVVEGGYVATVSCDDLLGVGDFSPNIDFTYYPNPANEFVNIVSKTEITSIEVYNVTGQLLYSNKTNTLDTKVDISSFSTGTYFFKLKFGEIGANFKIMKF